MTEEEERLYSHCSGRDDGKKWQIVEQFVIVLLEPEIPLKIPTKTITDIIFWNKESVFWRMVLYNKSNTQFACHFAQI